MTASKVYVLLTKLMKRKDGEEIGKVEIKEGTT